MTTTLSADCLLHPVPVSHQRAGGQEEHHRLHLILRPVSECQPPEPQFGPRQQQPEQLGHGSVGCRETAKRDTLTP